MGFFKHVLSLELASGINRWEEGKPLGKYQASKGTVAPVAYVPRPRGLGLGAQPAAPPEKAEGGKRRIPKSGEGPRFDGMVVAPDADGKVGVAPQAQGTSEVGQGAGTPLDCREMTSGCSA